MLFCLEFCVSIVFSIYLMLSISSAFKKFFGVFICLKIRTLSVVYSLTMVNLGEEQTVAIDLSQFRRIGSTATLTVLSGDLKAKNTRESPGTILPEEKTLKIKKHSTYTMPAHSVSVIRIKSK